MSVARPPGAATTDGTNVWFKCKRRAFVVMKGYRTPSEYGRYGYRRITSLLQEYPFSQGLPGSIEVEIANGKTRVAVCSTRIYEVHQRGP